MKGLHFIATGPISDEAKATLKRMMEKRDERLKKMQEDFDSGKFDHIINQL